MAFEFSGLVGALRGVAVGEMFDWLAGDNEGGSKFLLASKLWDN